MKFDVGETIVGGVSTGVLATASALTTIDILNIIYLILAIASALVSLIILPLINWYRHAKADGKITADEVKSGVDTLTKGIEETKDVIDKITDEKGEE